jgi:hypothetical protein
MTTDPPRSEGASPEAAFEAAFEKYVFPDTPFSPFYSWDAHMRLDVSVFRKGSGGLNFTSTFQTIGTQNLGSKVSVGGTGYLLGVGHVQAMSDELALQGGFTHLSSHLTRDLDGKVDEQRREGEDIPVVEDPDEFNVVWFGLYRKMPAWPFRPEIEIIVTPVNFLFTGDDAGDVRPVYVRTGFTLWRGARKSVTAATRHEIGHNAFNSFSLSWELFTAAQQEGRVQLFVAATPGDSFHVSPHIGGLRDGLAFGVRLRFPG